MAFPVQLGSYPAVPNLKRADTPPALCTPTPSTTHARHDPPLALGCVGRVVSTTSRPAVAGSYNDVA